MLSISIVVYELEEEIFSQLLLSLAKALDQFQKSSDETAITIIDNNNQEAGILACLADLDIALPKPKIISNNENLGYGRGHNQGILSSTHKYHLILNPDVILDEQCLLKGIRYLDSHEHVCAVAPYAEDSAGRVQYLAKQYPAVADLLLRGFAPRFLREKYDKRLSEYELREIVEKSNPGQVPIISGCFMLCDTEKLKQVGGFDERYFLYFEDFSLSVKLNRLGDLHYLPDMRIIHHGGNAAGKGIKHLWYFTVSAFRFFNQHGWKLF